MEGLSGGFFMQAKGAPEMLRNKIPVSVRMSPQERVMLDNLSKRFERSRSDVLRLLIRKAGELLCKPGEPQKEAPRN